MRRTMLALAVVGALASALRVVAPGLDPPAAGGQACGASLPAGGLLWSFEGDGPIGAMPAVAEDGTVVFGTRAGTVFAVGCEGAERWRYRYVNPTPPYIGAQAFEGSPAIDEDGTILIGDDFLVPNYFFALHPDGTLRWMYETLLVNSNMDASPAIDAQGRIFTGSGAGHLGGTDGRVFAFDRSGRLLDGFSYYVDQPMNQGPVVAADDHTVFVAQSGSMYRYFSETATPTTVPTARPMRSPTVTRTATPRATRTPTRAVSPVATAGTPVHAHYLPWSTTDRGEDRPVRDASGRTSLAQFIPIPARIHVLTDGEAPGRAYDLGEGLQVSEPAAVGNVVLFAAYGGANGAAGGTLAAYRLTDPPARLWEFAVLGGASAPVVGAFEPGGAGEEVYFQDGNGDAVAVDAPSASRVPIERWRTPLGPVRGAYAPAIGDAGLVYFAAGRRVVALWRDSGDVAWERDLGGAEATTDIALAPDGTLYVATGAKLHAIATESGGPDPDAAWPMKRHDPRNTARADR